jgi:hypothetical protein
MAQATDHLPGKHEALSSTPNIEGKKEKGSYTMSGEGEMNRWDIGIL